MDYEIIATLGPASSRKALWKAFISAGVTGFRLNTSHLTIEQLDQWLDRFSRFQESLDAGIPLVLDLQGSKWRLGEFAPLSLEAGRMIDLVHAASTGLADTLPVPHEDFFQAAPISSPDILLDDARVALVVESAGPERVKARVVTGGQMSQRKGITFRASDHRKESLNEKDREILEMTSGISFIRYAVSYVRDAAEMSRYRAMIGAPAYVIAKLERRTALEEPARIALFADELWLCRGDLGSEMGMASMAIASYRFSRSAGSLSMPVLLAGQVLEHMKAEPVPTRAEVCGIHDALVRGYAGFVLSDETAVGKYPEESCRAAALFRPLKVKKT